MNFGEKHVRDREEILHSSQQRIIQKLRINAATMLIVLAIGGVMIVGFGAAGIIRGLFDSAPVLAELNMIPDGNATRLYDEDGKLIQNLSKVGEYHKYVSIDDISHNVQNAFVVAQDSRFYEHQGIDVKGILQSVYSELTGHEEEAQISSTITMQLLENQVYGGGNETNWLTRSIRRLQEQYVAVELEHKMDKSKILEYYLNTICLGEDIQGVQEASLYFFNKEVSELSISEASALAAIARDPSQYDPVANADVSGEERKSILKAMLEQNFIHENEYEDALGEDVYGQIQSVYEMQSHGDNSQKSAYVDAVIDSVIADLQEKMGYSLTQAYNAIYTGGLRIITCQDTQAQEICNKVVNDSSYYPKGATYALTYHMKIKDTSGQSTLYNENNVKEYAREALNKRGSFSFSTQAEAHKMVRSFRRSILKKGDIIEKEKIILTKQPQTSVVLMDQSSGEVKALVGQRGKNDTVDTTNRATQELRQPGSVLSTLASYLPALDTEGMTLGDVVDDSPSVYPDSQKRIINLESKGYQGLISLRDALIQSDNVAAEQVYEQIQPQTGFDYLCSLGFSTVVEKRETQEDKIYSDVDFDTSTGNLIDGVSNLELTAAYASVANYGEYHQPIFYTKIVDHDGNILIHNESEEKRVMKKETSGLLTNALQDAIVKGTGTEAVFDDLDMPEAGKTGLSLSESDNWFEGYTPYYTAGIWTGYDNGSQYAGTTSCQRMWKSIMEQLHKQKELSRAEFILPDNLVTCEVCTKSGKLAVNGVCDEAQSGDCTRLEYYVKGTEPTDYCDRHVKYKICKKSGRLAGDSCPSYDVKSIVYLIKEETGKTNDTPFILPDNLVKQLYCNKH